MKKKYTASYSLSLATIALIDKYAEELEISTHEFVTKLVTEYKGAVQAEIKLEKPAKKPKCQEKLDGSPVQELYDYYMKVFNRDKRYKLEASRKAVINARLEDGYTVDECKKVIDYIRGSEFHMGNNPQNQQYIDLRDHIFNKTKFEKFLLKIQVGDAKPTAKIDQDPAQIAARLEERRKQALG